MIQKASTSDYTNIIRLLNLCELPITDIKKSSIDFWLIKDDEIIIATAALEKANDSGIFRSFAVHPLHRGKGAGKNIYDHVMDEAKTLGISTLYLLTTTAEKYFAKKGWKITDRQVVPDLVRKSEEFRSICPTTAVCMKLSLTI